MRKSSHRSPPKNDWQNITNKLRVKFGSIAAACRALNIDAAHVRRLNRGSVIEPRYAVGSAIIEAIQESKLRGVNKVILVGRVGDRPKLTHTSGGDPIATVSLATSRVWKNKTTGEQGERTEWHRIKFYGPIATVIDNNIDKGAPLYVEGEINYESWNDKATGEKKYATTIRGNNFEFLPDPRRASGHPSNSGPAADEEFSDVPF